MRLMEIIDKNTSSCINGLSTKKCQINLDTAPNRFRHFFDNSLYYGKFPMSWTCALFTLIPNEGDKELPGNWRPISQTIIYAKILDKIVHEQLLA